MTESEWVGCTDPERMLEFVRGQASERKLRLFAVACCRSIWHLLTDARSQKGLELAEAIAEGRVGVRSRSAKNVHNDAHIAYGNFRRKDKINAALAASYACWPWAERSAETAARAALERATEASNDRIEYAGFLKCVLRTSFRPITNTPAWLTPTVSGLAQTAYEERTLPSGELDPDRLAVLSDALEEAGCDDGDILNHLRSSGPHVRGCWVVDLLTGRS